MDDRSSNSNNGNKREVKKFTKSLTLFIPSYDDEVTSEMLSSNQEVAGAADNQFQISSPDSAFHTGSEFNPTEDSFDQNSMARAIRNDKVERWVKTTATGIIGNPDGIAHSSDDFEDFHSVGSMSFNIQTPPSASAPRQKFVIEEQVEEIITTNSYEDSDENSSSVVEENKSDKSESGGSDAYDSMDDVMDTTNQPLSWEHNWLFKKKRFRQPRGMNGGQKFRTTMFIPNPTSYSSSQYFVDEDELDENEDLSLESLEILPESDIDEESESEAQERFFETNKSAQSGETQRRPSNEKVNPVDIFISRRSSHTIKPLPNLPESTEETLRETSQSLIASNDTIEIEDKKLLTEALVDKVKHASQPKKHVPITDIEIVRDLSQNQNTETNLTSETELEDTEDDIGENSTNFKDSNGSMRIAKREKEKWNNPVKILNNPYTPENLLKRMTNNSFLHCHDVMSGHIEVEADELVSGDFSVPLDSLSSNQKIRRDYYVNSDTSQGQGQGQGLGQQPPRSTAPGAMSLEYNVWSSAKNEQRGNTTKFVTISSASSLNSSGLSQMKLPSVKNLAQQFTDTSPCPKGVTMTPKTTKARDRARKAFEPRPFANPMKEIHSLTARSVPKQFREGLRLAKSPVSNPNIKTNKS